jgi:hypothetical protein
VIGVRSEDGSDALGELCVCALPALVESTQRRQHDVLVEHQGRGRAAERAVADVHGREVVAQPHRLCVSGDQPGRRQQRHELTLDALGVGPVVGVLERDDRSATMRDRMIADLVGAAVLGHAKEADPWVHGGDGLEQLVERRRRAVVDHEDLEVAPGLGDQRGHRRTEALVGLVGRHDDCHQRVAVDQHVGRYFCAQSIEGRACAVGQRDRQEAEASESHVQGVEPALFGASGSPPHWVRELCLRRPSCDRPEHIIVEQTLDMVEPSGSKVRVRLDLS